MTAAQKVIIAGATGYLGKVIIEALKASGFTITILTRGVDAKRSGKGCITTDYSKDSLMEALRGQDVVISTIGAAGIMQQTELIDAAISVGIKRFIPSDYAPNTPNLSIMEELVPDLFARLKPRQDILNYLKENSKMNREFTWTSFGSCPLLDWSLKTGAQGISLATKSAVMTDSGNELYPTTTVPQIARAIVYVLTHLEETANRYYLVKSLMTTQNEIVNALRKAAPDESWRVEYKSSEQRRIEGLELISNGNPAGLGCLWNVWYNTDGKNNDNREKSFANKELHLEDEDLDSIVSRAIAATSV